MLMRKAALSREDGSELPLILLIVSKFVVVTIDVCKINTTGMQH